MIIYENDCCGCATGAYPCLGDSYSLRHAAHYYCDECGWETSIYEFDEQELCIRCIEQRLRKIK